MLNNEPLNRRNARLAHGPEGASSHTYPRILHRGQKDGVRQSEKAAEIGRTAGRASRGTARGPPTSHAALGRCLGIGPAITDRISSNDRDSLMLHLGSSRVSRPGTGIPDYG